MDGGNTNVAYSKDIDEAYDDDIERNNTDEKTTNATASEDKDNTKDDKLGTNTAGMRVALKGNDNDFQAVVNGKKLEAGEAGDERCRLSACFNIGKGVMVRLCLVVGNVIAVWRTVTDTDQLWPWALTAVCVLVMAVENLLVIRRTGGREWTWWSPCIMIYLATTLPAVWLLQLQQREIYIQQTGEILRRGVDIGNGHRPQYLASGSNRTTAHQTPSAHQPTAPTTTPSSEIKLSDLSLEEVMDINTDTWVIIVGESLIYLIVFARWFLPRGDITREFLADLLLEFLAIASDIMELLAIFDIHEIRSNKQVTLWILSIWSISFIQFIPVLMHKRKYLHVKSPSVRWIMNIFGDYFVEVVVTCMSVFLQDGPFLVLRLYVMIKLDRITYSLVFFVFKNIVSLFLLFYRLTILFSRLPVCCCAKRKLIRRARTVEYADGHNN